MARLLQNPSFLPACILAAIGVLLLVLVWVLPARHVCALAGGTAVAVGLVFARLRREALRDEEEHRSGGLTDAARTAGTRRPQPMAWPALASATPRQAAA